MELEDLAIFRTVVHEGGILKAVRKLHRVPSSITTRVQQLEASLGTDLFYRHRQRLRLSAGGYQLLDYAERLLRLSDEARQAVVGGAPRGVLRIGALESTTASRLPAVLDARARAEFLPRDRRLRGSGRRHRAGARSGARDLPGSAGDAASPARCLCRHRHTVDLARR